MSTVYIGIQHNGVPVRLILQCCPAEFIRQPLQHGLGGALSFTKISLVQPEDLHFESSFTRSILSLACRSREASAVVSLANVQLTPVSIVDVRQMLRPISQASV
jgi:hypothetical protein